MGRADELVKLGRSGSPKDIKSYDPSQLERFQNRHIGSSQWVKLVCKNFTSVCPVTYQPDHATIYINYLPEKWMVESKSLKLYIVSFRNHGAFHEDIVFTVMNDLVKLLSPNYLEVYGDFEYRGDIAIKPFSTYTINDDKFIKIKNTREINFSVTEKVL